MTQTELFTGSDLGAAPATEPRTLPEAIAAGHRQWRVVLRYRASALIRGRRRLRPPRRARSRFILRAPPRLCEDLEKFVIKGVLRHAAGPKWVEAV